MAILNGKQVSKRDLLKKIGNMAQLASIRPCRLTEGRADGVRAFEVTTGGGLDFTVLEGKCLDLFDMRYKGTNLSFIAKPGLSAPEYFSPFGTEFFRSFQAGMLYTCGLSNIGVPCRDDGEEYNLHGRISQTPAEKVCSVAQWEGEEYVLQLSGEMREAAHFKENLVLKRSLRTKLGARSVEIHDRVENQGCEEQPVMLLYHFNLGYPLVDDGTRVLVPALETIPRTEVARQGMADFDKITAPVDRFAEHVFYHKNASDAEGNTYTALINDGLELGVYIRFNIKQLPILVEWKSMASGDYALGLEPGTNYLEGREVERRNHNLHLLAPLEQLHIDLEVGILDGKEEISAFEERIRSLKG